MKEMKTILYYSHAMDEFTEAEWEQMIELLPPKRRERVEKTRHPEAKKELIFAYILLLYGMQEAFGSWESRDFTYGENGKPVIEGADFHFNMSHTKGAAACILSPKEAGVDIQQYIKPSKGLIRRVCSASEQEQLAKSTEEIQLFTKYWTRKEACVKCMGTGIWDHMEQLDFSEDNSQFREYEVHTILEENYGVSSCSFERIDDCRCIKKDEIMRIIIK